MSQKINYYYIIDKYFNIEHKIKKLPTHKQKNRSEIMNVIINLLHQLGVIHSCDMIAGLITQEMMMYLNDFNIPSIKNENSSLDDFSFE